MRPSDPASAPPQRFSAFSGDRLIARGELTEVVRAVHEQAAAPLLVLADSTGLAIDLDLRGSAEDAVARVSGPAPDKPRRGRPKLGVTAREVTLLPRHWDWLAGQPGGASVTLRRLVEEARSQSGAADAARRARDAAYRAMTTLAGDLPGYEEAVRALFAGDRAGLATRVAHWPGDISTYIAELASAAGSPSA